MAFTCHRVLKTDGMVHSLYFTGKVIVINSINHLYIYIFPGCFCCKPVGVYFRGKRLATGTGKRYKDISEFYAERGEGTLGFLLPPPTPKLINPKLIGIRISIQGFRIY